MQNSCARPFEIIDELTINLVAGEWKGDESDQRFPQEEENQSGEENREAQEEDVIEAGEKMQFESFGHGQFQNRYNQGFEQESER